MVDEITHICKDMPKRTPGEEGERIACEYMADVLKKTADANAPTLNRLRKIPAAFRLDLYHDHLRSCGAYRILLPADIRFCAYRFRFLRNDNAIRSLQKDF